MFDTVFKQFDQVVKETSLTKRNFNMKAIKSGEDNQDFNENTYGPQDKVKNIQRLNKKKRTDLNKKVELTLAIAIIIANLSSDEEFINTLLGVDVHWKKALKDTSL
jgi:hypothetical protein